MNPAPRALILYDDTCNLCSGAVRFITRRDPHGYFHFAALQSEAAERALSAAGERSQPSAEGFDSLVLIENGTARMRSDAALAIAAHLRAPWSSIAILRVFPRFARDAAYRLVAANRYRLFGRRDAASRITPR